MVIIPTIILSAILSYFAYSQYHKNIDLEKENKSLNKKINDLENEKDSLYEILPGKKALLPNFGLVLNKKDDFKVNYEVDVLEVSKNKVKVSAYGFTSNDVIGNDPSNRNIIISFLKDKWVDKPDLEIILDTKDIRDMKIENIIK